jgi:hypothetical protein
MDGDRLTQATYALRIGVSRQRVHQLVKDGRIPTDDEGLVDVAQADANLATMLDQRKANRERQIELAAGPRFAPHAEAPAAPVAESPDAPLDLPLEMPLAARPTTNEAPDARPMTSGGTSAATDYWEQKARRERIEADRADLAYRVSLGKLVDADEVSASRRETAYRVANALTQIPARVAPVIAPQDPMRAERLLTDEINRILNELAGDMERAAADDAERPDARAA